MEQKVTKTIKHFGLELDIPNNSKIEEYVSLKKKKQKKNKDKLTKFSYYKIKNGQILKVLFRDDESYIQQGFYPFTDPICKIKDAKQLGNLNPQRLVITEAAYIGHQEDKMYVKKMKQISLQLGKIEMQTVDDNFEVLKIGNEDRFKQFLKIMSLNPKSNEMSIRVIINESNPDKPQIIDYQFFFRQDQLKKNKNLFQ